MQVPVLPSRYTIHSLLGEGESGHVFRVRDALRDRELALKLVSASDAAFLRREFDTLRQIRHENLIQVFDWGALPSGEAYYTMELVDGEDWGHRMGAPQPEDEVRRILTGVLRGLAHLHCHSEIHGDLKPGNILLGRGGVVKVTDVGMGGSGPGSGMAGTPGYAAPECWEEQPASVRSDLYSVGVMGYEALSGRHPFQGRTIREVVRGQMEGWVLSPGVHGVRVAADLERVVMRALERSPALRQGSCDEFMEGMGVENRVGVILGGKFSGRGTLIPDLFSMAERKGPGDPTLLVVSGPPGVGKTETLEQLGSALVAGGTRCIQVSESDHAPVTEILAHELSAAKSGDPKDRIAHLVDVISSEARQVRVAILVDTSALSESPAAKTAKGLAQRLWAASEESGEPIQATVILSEEAPVEGEVFARPISLQTLDEHQTLELARGTLGALDVEPGAAASLHLASGGNPSAVLAVLFDAMSRGDLERIEGRWRLQDIGRHLQSSSPTLADRWRRRWGTLSSGDHDLLALFAISPTAFDAASGPALELLAQNEAGIARLIASGWIVDGGQRLRLSSEGLREIVLESAPESRQRELAGRLVDGALLPARASLTPVLLFSRPSRDVVQHALEEARQAQADGDMATALGLLEGCRNLESMFPDQRAHAAFHLQLAEVLLECGENAAALRELESEAVFQTVASDPAMSVRRIYLRGSLYSREGSLAAARGEFIKAAELALQCGEHAGRMRALSSLGELTWTHGSEVEREATISLIESALSEGTEVAGEHRDRLVYGLGAALVRSGKFKKAVSVLEPGLERAGGGYWAARIANALSTAYVYLGNRDGGLSTLARGLELLERNDAPDVRARIHANRGSCLNAMGRVREALDDNQRALHWSRRSGSSFDVIAALAGIAIDLYYLGRFDEAIAKSREVREMAQRVGDIVYVFKGLEVEGFARLAIGDVAGLERLLSEIALLPQDHDPIRTVPRIEWLRARLYMIRGERNAALEALARGARILSGGEDLEDLWRLEVELAVLNEAQTGSEVAMETLAAIACKAGDSKIVVVEILAVTAIAQILTNGGKADPNKIRLLTSILGRAEESGFVDEAWRLNLGLGISLLKAGDIRAGQTRLIQSQRLLGQIANGLSDSSRRLFVDAPHVASALERISQSLNAN